MLMPNDRSFVLGFDPGGKQGRGNFGWSICEVVNGILMPPIAGQIGVAHDALEARDNAMAALPADAAILAAGIDAPLFWGHRGYRHVDQVLKGNLTGVANSVCHINGMRGACLVQGIVLAHHLRDICQGLDITECHPAVLQFLLENAGKAVMAQSLMVNIGTDPGNHKRDATRAAISAWAGVQELDTWINLYAHEPNPVHPFDPPVSYYMPNPGGRLSEAFHNAIAQPGG